MIWLKNLEQNADLLASFQDYLSVQESAIFEQLAACSTFEDVRYEQGRLAFIRHLKSLPHLEEKQNANRNRYRLAAGPVRGDNASDAATAGNRPKSIRQS